MQKHYQQVLTLLKAKFGSYGLGREWSLATEGLTKVGLIRIVSWIMLHRGISRIQFDTVQFASRARLLNPHDFTIFRPLEPSYKCKSSGPWTAPKHRAFFSWTPRENCGTIELTPEWKWNHMKMCMPPFWETSYNIGTRCHLWWKQLRTETSKTRDHTVLGLSCIASRPSFLRVRADAILGSSTIFHV